VKFPVIRKFEIEIFLKGKQFNKHANLAMYLSKGMIEVQSSHWELSFFGRTLMLKNKASISCFHFQACPLFM
jgi:hypothetical protein